MKNLTFARGLSAFFAIALAINVVGGSAGAAFESLDSITADDLNAIVNDTAAAQSTAAAAQDTANTAVSDAAAAQSTADAALPAASLATSETDPTVPASIKDGIDWSELTGIPADFADGVDNNDAKLTEAEVDAYTANNGYLTTETDPTVNAAAKADLSTCAAGDVLLLGSSGWECSTNVSGTGKWSDGTTSGDIYYTGGNVGIGTTSPDVDLDIRDSGNTGLRLYNTNAATQKYTYLQLMTENYTDTGDIGSEGLEIGLYDTTGTAYIAREVNGGIKSSGIAIDKSGNVGIGTTTPNAKLEVNGEIIQTGSTRKGYVYNHGNNNEKIYHHLGRVNSWCGAIGVEGQFESHHTNVRGTGNFDLSFARRDGLKVNGFASGKFGESLDIELYETEEGLIMTETTNQKELYGENLDVYLVTGLYAMTNINISQTPGCGEINTAEITPQEKSETSHDGKDPYYKLSTDGATLFTDVNGSVGFGTASPDAKLDVEGAIQADTFTGEAKIYTHAQEITTNSAVDVEHFAMYIGQGVYSTIALVNQGDGTVDTYQFDYSGSGLTVGNFQPKQTLTGFTNPNDAEVFQEYEYDEEGNIVTATETYLIVGDASDAATLHQWNGSNFVAITGKEIPTTGHTDTEVFYIDGQQVIALAQSGEIDIRTWDGSEYSIKDPIKLDGVQKLHFFEADLNADDATEGYLAAATASGLTIYQWQEGQGYYVFSEFATLDAPNAQNAHFFGINKDSETGKYERQFLMVPSDGNVDSPLYEWNGTEFEVTQTLDTYSGSVAATNFEFEGTEYLVLTAKGNSDSNYDYIRFFYYEDDIFKIRQSLSSKNIATGVNGLMDIETWFFGGEHRLMLAEATPSRVLRIEEYNNVIIGIDNIGQSEEHNLYVPGGDILMSMYDHAPTDIDGISYDDTDNVYSFHADQEHRPGWDDPGAAISAKGGYFAGKVGIGTSSPDADLEVKGSGITAVFSNKNVFGSNTGIKIVGARNATTSGNTAYLDLADFDSNEGDNGTEFVMGRVAGGMNDVEGQTGFLQFFTNSGADLSEKMRIDKNGNVGIGTTEPGARLEVIRDSGSIFNAGTSTNKTMFQMISNGTMEIAGNVVQTSDSRYKKEIQTLPSALQNILSLRGVSYYWKDRDDDTQQIGVIAQEVEKIYPQLVHTNEDGYKSVAYANLVSPLIEAVKELHALYQGHADRIAALEEQIQQLQERYEDIEARLTALEAAQ